MSYNRKNLLLRVKKVTELYHIHKVEDVPMAVTFRKHIEPVYPMHLETFYLYLGINYTKELRELEAKEKNKKQIELF
jgi:hypothetical protein